jgi:hypothetical protein
MFHELLFRSALPVHTLSLSYALSPSPTLPHAQALADTPIKEHHRKLLQKMPSRTTLEPLCIFVSHLPPYLKPHAGPHLQTALDEGRVSVLFVKSYDAALRCISLVAADVVTEDRPVGDVFLEITRHSDIEQLSILEEVCYPISIFRFALLQLVAFGKPSAGST